LVAFIIRAPQDSKSWSVLDLVGIGVLSFGFFMAAWSRFVLGKEWRMPPEIRKDHRLITWVPYTIVRNPMYLGLLSMALGVNLMIGFDYSLEKWANFLPLLIFLIHLKFIPKKIQMEEELLEKRFGEEWKNYVKKTPYRIVPMVY
jgi:protein-S-isoprenylcysteine O-methyltransferase Ste14